MKVALVSCSSVRYMPYMELYKSILDRLDIEYVIINEHEIEEVLPGNHFAYKVNTQKSVFKKFSKLFGWRTFVKKIIKEQSIDCAIILTTWPGVKLIDFWNRKFKGKFILDIRDFTSEGNKIYSMCVNSIIKKSFMTVVSSEKFKTWLIDSDKISVAHNMPVEYKDVQNASLKNNQSYTIGYVGLVYYEKQNKALVDAFSNCDNVTLKFKGTIQKSCHIKEYCEENNIKNVEFTGRYNNSEKQKLYDDIDIINAIYGNDSLIVTTALPNKLYDGIIYKKPIIASKGTYLGELVENYNIGIAVDTENDNLYEVINAYVENFDEEKFLSGCRSLLDKVTSEHKNTIEKIEKLFENQDKGEKSI